MKKILMIGVLISALTLTSCNMNVGWGSYSFHKVHVQMYGNEPTHFKVKSWKSDTGGIELKLENYGTILLGDGTYMLYDTEDCPICGEVQYK